MDKINLKKFSVPRCLERSPEVFGLPIQTVVISMGLILVALIIMVKSILLSFMMIGIMYGNIKLQKKIKKIGGVVNYILYRAVKQKNIKVDNSIKFLIKSNKNGE